jgi:hypothetical protein
MSATEPEHRGERRTGDGECRRCGGEGCTACDARDLVGLVAGMLSTFPPHHLEHPENCIPMARAVVNALEGKVYDQAFEMAHDDVLTAWRVRNAALAVAATFVHPGPDHADMTARQALVREWVSDGHDQVEEENHQRTEMLRRMVEAERSPGRCACGHMNETCDLPASGRTPDLHEGHS